MPTSDTSTASFDAWSGRPTKYKRRARYWENTPNYWTTPKDQLPIRRYTDQIADHSQNIARATQYINGTLNSEVAIGYSDTTSMNNAHQSHKTEAEKLIPSYASQYNEAKVKAYAKVSDAKVNVGVALAEASKTSDLILGAASRLYQAYRGFRRGDLRAIAKNLNISPRKFYKNWLEYKYGWMPVVMDVKNAAEFFAQQHVGRPIRFTAQAVSRSQGKWRPATSYSGYSTLTSLADISREVKVKIWCEITNPHLTAVQQLGLTNPALVVWELVPYSFVFDWFCSVGNYLQALTAFHGVTTRRAMVSHTVVCTSEYQNRNRGSSSYSPGYVVVNTPYHFKFTGNSRTYDREVHTVSPESLYPPVKDDPFNWNRLMTGLALIQARSRRFG